MATAKKIPYYNLRDEAGAGRIPVLIGRQGEIERLDRLLGRRTSNNALVVGESGIGKTMLVWGWMKHVSHNAQYDRYALLQLDAEHVSELEHDAGLEDRYREALQGMPQSVVFLDGIGQELYRNLPRMQQFHRVYKNLLAHPDVHVVMTLQAHEYAWLEHEYPVFLHAFETITLKRQSASECQRILSQKMPRLNAARRVIVPDSALHEIVELAERYPALGVLPRSAVHLLDESISLCLTQKQKILTADSVARVVEAKTGIPSAHVRAGALQGIRGLEEELNARIVNQRGAVRTIATTLQRAKLGLRNPNRPLGSFLLLGPSGVGKTETAKSVAELMFGRPESFVRIDMSEFQHDHTIQRLIGAPPGYVGYEEGGALTNALKREPYSLILLDEIEKAHPKVFDIFLQVLDDGRLTSGQNETVDARNAIVMATSNAAVAEIVGAHEKGENVTDDSFVRSALLPILTKTFRPEFINRFDSILVFNPLSVEGLMEVAQLEIGKIEKRLAKHHVRFAIEPHVLEEKIQRLADPRFGARPVKRFIEEACETLLVQSLLSANT